MRMKNIVILISGRGSNMEAIVRAFRQENWPARLCAVISNRADAAGLVFAERAGIPTRVVSHKDYADRETYDAALQAVIDTYEPDLVILAGFMRILTARRMIALADFSAGDPSRWRTIRARFFFEELSVNDLAEMLGISRRTVTRHLQPLHLSEDIYDGLVRIPGNTPPKGTFPQGSSCE